ncbi:MAG: MarR family winged helix-turn-helix transcriptional regulator [Nocardioidaceae bacterium]
MARERPDLGVLLHRLTSTVAQREQPLLRAHQIEMWDYVVLGGLEHGPAPTQAQLAASVGRDKTRLITILDRLEARGLLCREPDPGDRRNRVVTLTDAGRSLLLDCRRDIRAMEADLLSTVGAADRTAFIRVLSGLVESTRDHES